MRYFASKYAYEDYMVFCSDSMKILILSTIYSKYDIEISNISSNFILQM